MSDPTLSRGVDAAYREALIARLGGRDPVEELAALFERLPAALEGLSEEELRRPETEGKWSILEVVCHLADTELAQGWRMRRILTEDNPTLEPMDQDAWASRLRYDARDLEETLDQLRALRLANLRLVERLDDAELERTAYHPERGSESLRTVIELVAGHDGVHLDQIRRIREAVSAAADVPAP